MGLEFFLTSSDTWMPPVGVQSAGESSLVVFLVIIATPPPLKPLFFLRRGRVPSPWGAFSSVGEREQMWMS